MDEHRLIEQVLEAMEKRLQKLNGGPFPAEFFEQALDFFANFADGCHHFKEEDKLFRALERKGVAVEGGPIGVMLHEHNLGRACLAGIRENLKDAAAGSGEAVQKIRQHGSDYIGLLRQHIWKEDNVLFRMAHQALSPEEAALLQRDFRDDSNPRIASETRRRYQELAEKLAAAAH